MQLAQARLGAHQQPAPDHEADFESPDLQLQNQTGICDSDVVGGSFHAQPRSASTNRTLPAINTWGYRPPQRS